jgi:ATP-dependent Clp protease adaptor protein ClpS
MLEIHNKGFAVCGIYPLDVAETKVAQVTHKARAHEHPLKCTLEKA